MRKKNSRKIIALLLSLAMIFSMNLQAFADESVSEASLGEAALESTENADDSAVLPEAETAESSENTEAAESSEDSESSASADFVEGLSENTISPNEAEDTVSGDETEEAAGEDSGTIEINQAMSIHTGLNDGNPTYMSEFVAGKRTAVMVKIPSSDSMEEAAAKNAAANYTMVAKAVTNGQEADNNELSGDANPDVLCTYDDEDDQTKGYYAVWNFPTGPDKGTYNFIVKDGDNEIARREGITFYETNNLNILVVPVKGYWGGAYSGGAPSAGAYSCKEGKFYDTLGNEQEWSQLTTVLKDYLLDVYPVANITLEEGNEVDASDASYDMCGSDGQKKLWEEVCKLQSKTKDGKDRYDLILAFVQYRQDQGGGQGYTFGKPTNIITYSDKDMLPTVAHEIAHCYQVGDEYDGGSFNNSVNFPPNGYKGRSYVDGSDIAQTEGANAYWKTPKDVNSGLADGNAKKGKIEENGAGTVVPLSLHPYSLSQKKYIQWAQSGETYYPTMSYMGSNYSGSDGYYWTSSVIWDHLLKQLIKKEKQEQAAEESSETSNADVFLNSVASDAQRDENTIFTEEDEFYYSDDYRFGQSRMIEVNGWLTADAGATVSAAGFTPKVEMEPMFSYDGDLETIEPLEDIYKKGSNVYTFAAVDKDGKVITSPVDQKPSTVEFYGGFYNPNTKKTGAWQHEVNFNFDAEYPEGTADFIIIKGKVAEDGKYSTPLWKASADENFKGKIDNKVEGYLNYAEVTSANAVLEWDLYYPEGGEEPFDNSKGELYTEVYYCPEGDDGEAYFVGDSEGSSDIRDGSVSFDTNAFDTKWTRNAYVWVKVTNGINAVDIYSDENDVTLCYSTVKLSGTGIKSSKDGNEVYYSAEYTGSEIKPTVTVKAQNPETGKYDISLTKNVDYTVTYQDNINVGYASVIVQGIGSYAGKNTKEFEITKKSVKNATPQYIPSIKYVKDLDSAVKKYIVLTDNKGNELINGTDFTTSFSNGEKSSPSLNKVVTADPEDETTVTVSYKGKGNYTGTCSKTISFVILPSKSDVEDLVSSNVVLKKTEMQYTGKALKPAIKMVSINGVKLKPSQYKVIYSNNVSLGKGRVTVIGKKGYIGSASATFDIVPKKVKSIKVTGLKSQAYTGETISVDSIPIVVKAGGITLTKGVDYTVSACEGADYKSVTTRSIKKAGKAPGIVVNLISLSDAQKKKMKSSQLPKVEWKNSEKPVKKTFSIVKANLGSSAVTSLTLTSTSASLNIVSADSVSDCTMRSVSKNEFNGGKKKYAYVIEGKGDVLKNADVTKALSFKAFGDALKAGEDYTVTVSTTRAGKIGKITFKAKGAGYRGKRVYKFKYVNKQ